MSLSFVVVIRPHKMADRGPPRSEPQSSHAFPKCDPAQAAFGCIVKRRLSAAAQSGRPFPDRRHIALAQGGEAGERIVQRLAMPVSADTLLRLATVEQRIVARH